MSEHITQETSSEMWTIVLDQYGRLLAVEDQAIPEDASWRRLGYRCIELVPRSVPPYCARCDKQKDAT